MAPTENFNSFSPATEDEIRKLIIKSSDAARLLDPMPIILVKAHIDILFPMITKIVNESLSSGPFPNDMTSLVKPGIQKPSLDSDVLKNYSPISKSYTSSYNRRTEHSVV
jgi:hypothetical protein